MPCPGSVQSAECPEMWLQSSKNALACECSMQNALALVVYSLQNALDWQCTVCRMPSSGSVQFAECSGLAVYSLQNALSLAVYSLQNVLTLAVYSLQNAQSWQCTVCRMP